MREPRDYRNHDVGTYCIGGPGEYELRFWNSLYERTRRIGNQDVGTRCMREPGE